MEGDLLWTLLAGVAIAHASDTKSDEPTWRPFTSVLDGFSHRASLDDIARATRELVAWLSANPQNVVSRSGGAQTAIELYREVQRALHMFPMDEPAEKIRFLRCRHCAQFAVVDRPPLHYLDPRLDVCQACGGYSDPGMREWDLKLYRLEVEELRRKAAETGEAA